MYESILSYTSDVPIEIETQERGRITWLSAGHVTLLNKIPTSVSVIYEYVIVIECANSAALKALWATFLQLMGKPPYREREPK